MVPGDVKVTKEGTRSHHYRTATRISPDVGSNPTALTIALA